MSETKKGSEKSITVEKEKTKRVVIVISCFAFLFVICGLVVIIYFSSRRSNLDYCISQADISYREMWNDYCLTDGMDAEGNDDKKVGCKYIDSSRADEVNERYDETIDECYRRY